MREVSILQGLNTEAADVTVHNITCALHHLLYDVVASFNTCAGSDFEDQEATECLGWAGRTRPASLQY